MAEHAQTDLRENLQQALFRAVEEGPQGMCIKCPQASEPLWVLGDPCSVEHSIELILRYVIERYRSKTHGAPRPFRIAVKTGTCAHVAGRAFCDIVCSGLTLPEKLKFCFKYPLFRSHWQMSEYELFRAREFIEKKGGYLRIEAPLDGQANGACFTIILPKGPCPHGTRAGQARPPAEGHDL